MAKWYVTGLDYSNMKNKTVKVTAPDKKTAIDKGLEKIGTKRFVDCKLISV